MLDYPVSVYHRAWRGCMVSHERFGGGVVMRVVADREDALVSVWFASGLRKPFRPGQVLAECRSLATIGAYVLDGDIERESTRKSRIAEAQRRHENGHWRDPNDLHERLLLRSGKPRMVQPTAYTDKSWFF